MGVRHREYTVEGVQFHPKACSPRTGHACSKTSCVRRAARADWTVRR
jgi:anthranilate/para-aminobenzoate synthase component II